MRRKDREVTDPAELVDILSRCDVVRIGIQGGQYPYVVPVSFGFEVVNALPVIYFHCARQGMKADMLRLNQNVCVEGDIYIKTEQTEHGITTRYESVIGFGVCEPVGDTTELYRGLRLLTEHYGYPEYPVEDCGELERLSVYRITFTSITGKRNPAAGL